MLKKSALTTLAVAAGLVAGAPLASAVEELPEAPSAGAVIGEGNDGRLFEDNVFNQDNGEGNTFNGQEIGLP